MLTITVPSKEFLNNETLEFSYSPEKTISLEHSLLSISKWESKWHIPFISDNTKTQEQILDYIKCMTITQNVDDIVYRALSVNKKLVKEIEDYISNPMTATTINDNDNGKTYGRRGVGRKITSEVLYAQMVECGIPWEAEKWHLNRLVMLISVCQKRGTPQKKMSAAETMQRHIATNAARRKH